MRVDYRDMPVPGERDTARFPYGEVRDLDTGELLSPTFFFDEETGEVGRFVQDDQGRFQIDPSAGRVRESWEVRGHIAFFPFEERNKP